MSAARVPWPPAGAKEPIAGGTGDKPGGRENPDEVKRRDTPRSSDLGTRIVYRSGLIKTAEVLVLVPFFERGLPRKRCGHGPHDDCLGCNPRLSLDGTWGVR